MQRVDYLEIASFGVGRQAPEVKFRAAVSAPASSDAALRSLQSEGRRSLDSFDSLRRMFAHATAPAPATE